MSNLQLKLLLIFIGAPVALAARPLGRPWLFLIGLTLLVLALAIPPHPDQSPKERARNLARHLPFLGWLRRKD